MSCRRDFYDFMKNVEAASNSIYALIEGYFSPLLFVP